MNIIPDSLSASFTIVFHPVDLLVAQGLIVLTGLFRCLATRVVSHSGPDAVIVLAPEGIAVLQSSAHRLKGVLLSALL